MKIIIAQSAGFCCSVQKAYENIITLRNKFPTTDIQILGELVHNNHVNKVLKDTYNITTIQSLSEYKGAIVVMRTHGEARQTYDYLQKHGIHYYDFTCPTVKYVQNIAKQLNDKGYRVIICGKKDHPEVIGIASYVKDPIIVSKPDDLPLNIIQYHDKIGILSQTTHNPIVFEEVKAKLVKKVKELKAFNTICPSTVQRKKESLKIAKISNCMLVIGSPTSSNTQELAHFCKGSGKPVYCIETAKQLQPHFFRCARKVGVTASASTPDFVIQEIVSKLEKM